jgi:tRNA-uridine 2-sulfurtransferase
MPLTEKESQDVCFIRDSSYGEFLARYFSPMPGPIEDTSGKVIGEHKGVHLFTIGQRRGINCPASEPYYVVKIDMSKNRLVVGFKNELFRQECRVEAINWIHNAPAGSTGCTYTSSISPQGCGIQGDSLGQPNCSGAF